MWEPKTYRLFQLNTWNIALIYLVMGLLWILFSDRLLEQLVNNPATLTRYQTYKGWFYVFITAVLLVVLLARYTARITRMRKEFVERFDLYRSLLEQGNQVVLQVDERRNFIYTNPAIREILGYDEDELQNLDDLEAKVHHSDIDRFYQIRDVYEADERDHDPFKKQLRIRRKDGSWRWFQMILTDKRSFEHIESRLLLVRDVHDETIVFEQLRESQRRFEHLFQEAPVGYHSLGSDFRIIDINKAELELLGYKREEVVGKMTWADLIATEDHPTFERQKKDLLEKGRADNLKYTIVRKDGSRRTVILNAKAFFDDSERLLYALANVVDLTDQLEAEKKLGDAYRKLNYHVQNTPLGFVEWNDRLRVTEWSPESESIFGWSKEEVTGMLVDEWRFIHDDDAPLVAEKMTEMLAGGELRNVISNRNYTKSGNVLYCEWHNSALLDDQGRLVSVMSLVHDITDRVRAQEKIRQLNRSLEDMVRERTRKLELANKELETFAYTVSHDLRAPLRSIDGFSRTLMDQYQDQLDERGIGFLKRVRNASQRMGLLIDDILALSRISRIELNVEQVDLSSLSREILQSLQEKEPEREATVDVDENMVVTGDARMIRIMMQNLLDNAWKYTSRRDHTRIEVGSRKENGNTIIYVQDNGVGFPMKYLEKLFLPFQRLHAQDDFPGTGVGLATVQRIIHRHAGAIWAKSDENEGAVFSFFLPDKSV